ncbi:ParA family protein [Gordonia otitidis]|uniref:ParA family protein n=1 Tax=Gordonia otitidis TaxID=249058 RepID=UPI000587668F|nr:ParA family protein [Gordonia otitidis]
MTPPLLPPPAQQLVVTLPNMAPPAKPGADTAEPRKPQPANRYRVREDSNMVKSPDKGVGGWWRRTSRNMGRQPALPTQELLRRVKTPLGSPKVIVFVNQDGGCAKTTTCCAVGQELATHRRDRIIAVDGASAVGGLTQRLPVDNQSTIRTLLNNLPTVRKWTDARQHTSMGRTGLELLASGNSIADDELLTADDYRQVIDVLTAHDTYNLILVDCEAGVTSALMDEVFMSADLVVIPAAGQDGVAGAIGVANRLAYLMDKYPQYADHFDALLTNAILVLTRLNARSTIKENAVSTMFRENIGITKIHRIPFDGLLIDGMPVDISGIDKRTEGSYLNLAAEIITSLAQVSHG